MCKAQSALQTPFMMCKLHCHYITQNVSFVIFLQTSQDLLNQQQNCKRCLSVIERNHHTVQRLISNSKSLRNFDQSLLQKRVLEIQSAAQVNARTHIDDTLKQSDILYAPCFI